MSSYELVIPDSVAAQFSAVVPYGITPGVLAQLDRLAEDPRLGLRVRTGDGPGPMAYTFKVDRPPLVLRVVVGYRFSADERKLVLTSVALVDDPDNDLDSAE